MARPIAECESWDLRGLGELDRWGREECQNDKHRHAVSEFLEALGTDPLVIEGDPVGMGFEGRFIRYLDIAPVLVTWLVVEELCLVTVLRVENIPG